MKPLVAAAVFAGVIALLAYAATIPGPAGAYEPTIAVAHPERPMRIASLCSESDEMLMGLVSPDRIACLTSISSLPDYSNVVDSALAVPLLISHISDVEPIIFMQPDLVVVNEFNRYEVVYLMEQAGLRVHRLLFPKTVSEVTSNLASLGRATGEEKKSSELIGRIDRLVSELRASTKHRRKVSTLFLSGGLWAQGDDSLPNDLIEIAGGTNILKGMSREVSPEEIMFMEPEVIVMSERAAQLFDADPALSTLKARRYTLLWGQAQPPSQFVYEALKRWAAMLHPDMKVS